MSPSICGGNRLNAAAFRHLIPNEMAKPPLRVLDRISASVKSLIGAILLCVIAFAGIVLAAYPHTAWADPQSIVVDSLIPNPYSYGGAGSFVRTSNGTTPVAYCAQGWLITPQEGQKLERHGDLDIPELDYVMYHGYDGETVTSLYGLDEEQSEAATTAAVWLAIGNQREDILGYTASDSEATHGNKMYLERWQRLENEQVKTAAMDLYEDAVDYRNEGAGGDEDGCAVLWLNRTVNNSDGTASYQALVTAEKTIAVTFQKTSSAPDITELSSVYSLQGATYEVYLADSEQLVDTITTDENGRATLALEPNTSYYAVETSTSTGYELTNEHIPFSTGTSSQTVELTSTPRTFAFEITKKDAATGGAAQPGASLEGAEYTLSSITTHRFATSGATDSEGHLTLEGIPLGKFQIVETRPSLGYVLDTGVKTYEVTPEDAENGEPFTLSPANDFPETPIACDIELIKTLDIGQPDDPDYGSTAAEGISFQIISNTTHEVVGTLTTDEQGMATSADMWMGAGTRPADAAGALPFDAAGYTVHEDPATTPEGFTALEDWTIKPEDLVNGATLHFAVTNTMVTSRVTIVKTDAATGNPVTQAGFSFTVLDGTGQPLDESAWYPEAPASDTFTTDETGQVTLPAYLRAGTYRIRETNAVAPYVLPQEDTVLEISEGTGSPEAAVSVADSTATGSATITNICSVDGQPLAGAEYDIVAQSDIVAPDGTVLVPAGQVAGHATTGADGTAHIEGLPLGGERTGYTLVQTEAAPGHALNTEPIPFELAYQDQQTPDVEARIEAVSEATGITISKVSAHDETKVLAGATFNIVPVQDDEQAPDSNDSTDETAPDSDDSTEGEDVEADAENEQMEDVENAAETNASAEDGDPVEDAPDDEADADQATEPSVNRPSGSNDDAATDEDESTPSDDGSDTDAATQYVTDETGTCSALHLESGTYRLIEIKAPAGYVSDSDGLTFTIDENGLIDGQANLPVHIANDCTKVDISKRSKLDESFVVGSQLVVLDSEDQAVDSWTTEAAPHRIEGIAPGSYVLAEKTAEGTYIEDTKLEFTVKETASVQTVTMYDEAPLICGQVDKRQELLDDEGGAGRLVSYSIDFRNLSDTWVDEFTVTDEIEAAADGIAEVETIRLPDVTGDVDGLVNVWYRTEGGSEGPEASDANATLDDGHANPQLEDQAIQMSIGEDARALDYQGWRLLKENVECSHDNAVSTDDLELQEGERIVAIRLEFGAVEADFSTSPQTWDRSDLKDSNDSFTPVQSGEQDTSQPFVVRLATTDAFRDGAELSNTASVDLYRSGGGDGLEAHDTDRVTQTAGAATWDLDQTGLSIRGFLMVAATAAGVSAISVVRGGSHRTTRSTRRRW